MKGAVSFMKQFARYVSLNILGMLGISCYILADTYFIAQWLGADGITALNLVIPIYNLINGLGLLFGIGSATKYVIYRNCNENLHADRIFTHSLYLCGLSGCLLILAGLFFPEQIVSLLGADANTFAMSWIYLKVLLICSPLFMLNQILLCFVRNDGAPERTMTAMLAGSFSNIILDYLFIFVLDLGMFGAVLATCCSPVISMLILLPFFIRKQNHFRAVKSDISLPTVWQILSLGGSSFITELSNGIVIFVLNILILKIAGNTGVAAYAIVANVSLVVTCVWTGTAQGMQPLVSEAYARNSSPRKYYRYACVTVLGLFLLIYGVIFWFADPIAVLFNKEQDAVLQQYAVRGMRCYFTGALFAGLNILTAMLLSATEKPVRSNLISLLRGLIFMIPSAWILSEVWRMSGLWFAYPVTELLTYGIARFFIMKKSPKKF